MTDLISDRVANTIRVNAPMDVDKALEHAILRLVMLGGPNDLPAAVTLRDILRQQGCENMDCGVPNTGRLVDAISVIVYG